MAQADTSENGGEVADVIPDWGTVLPKADIAKGQAITSKCASCHQFERGRHQQHRSVASTACMSARPPGTHPAYAYDRRCKDFAKTHTAWTYDLLYQFLKNPQGFMPGTKMTFVGLRDPQDRINVIAYLRSNGSPNFPIPAPAPAKPAAAPAGATAPAGNATAPATNAAAPATNAAK